MSQSCSGVISSISSILIFFWFNVSIFFSNIYHHQTFWVWLIWSLKFFELFPCTVFECYKHILSLSQFLNILQFRRLESIRDCFRFLPKVESLTEVIIYPLSGIGIIPSYRIRIRGSYRTVFLRYDKIHLLFYKCRSLPFAINSVIPLSNS